MRNNGWYFRFCPYELVECDADRLELRPGRAIRAARLMLIILGLAILLGLGRVSTFDPVEDRAARWLFGGGLVGLGAALGSLRRIVLDQRRDSLSIARWPFRTKQFPLSSITAVQVTHVPYSRSVPGRMRRPAGDRLDLLLNGIDGLESIPVTFHSQPSTTRHMALRIAELLGIEVNGQLPAEVVRPTVAGWNVRVRRIAAKLCFLGGVAALFGFLALSVEQRSRDELDKTLRPVQASLLERQVTEWIEGSGSWYVRGVFELTMDGQAIRAEGDLIPQSFYRDNFGGRRKRVVPRHIAAPFAEAWIPGNTYDGFIHSDQPTHIFFEPPPSGTKTRRQRWQIFGIALVLFAVGVTIVPKNNRA